MTTPLRTVTDPAKIAELIVRYQQAGDDCHLPLFREAMTGRLDVVMVTPRSRVPHRFLDPLKQRKPLVVILGGDGVVPAGPQDFQQANRLLNWCRFTMLHGAGGLPFHYQCAVQAAHLLHRVLVVECSGARLPEWVAAKEAVTPRTPGLIIAVPEGQPPHPSETAPAGTVLQ